MTTNNLDIQARQNLYDFVASTETGLLMVSHDRKLLRHCDEIIELSGMGVKVYGGDFDDYAEQKELQDKAVERQYEDAKQDCKKAQRAAQQALEAFDKKGSVGRKLFLDGKIDRISANGKRGRAEKTFGRAIWRSACTSAGSRLTAPSNCARSRGDPCRPAQDFCAERQGRAGCRGPRLPPSGAGRALFDGWT